MRDESEHTVDGTSGSKMASKAGESEKLRKQIQFLEDLISSASTTNNVRSTNPSTSRLSHSSHDGITHTRPHNYNKPYSNTGYNSRNTHTKYSWRKFEKSAHSQQRYDRDIKSSDATSLSRKNSYNTRVSNDGGKSRSDKSKSLSVENKNYVSEKAVLQDNSVNDAKVKEATNWENKPNINRSCNNELFRSLYKWNRNSEFVKKVETCDYNIQAGKISNRTCTLVDRSSHFFTNPSKNCEPKKKVAKDSVHVSSPSLLPECMKHDNPPKDDFSDIGISKSLTSASHSAKSVMNISSKHESLCKDILKTQTKLLELKMNLIEKKKKSKLSQVYQDKNDFQQSHRSNFLPMRGRLKPSKVSEFHSSTYKKHYRTHQLPNKKYTKYWVERMSQRPSMKNGYWRPYSSYLGGYRGKQRGGYSKYRTRVFSSYLHQGYGFTGRPSIQHHYYLKKSFYQRHPLRKQHVISKLNLKRRIERHRRLQDQVIFDPKKKLDRRKTGVRPKTQNFVLINGMLYKQRPKSLVKASCSASGIAKDNKKPHQTSRQHKIKFLNTTAMKTVIVRGVKFKVDRDGKSLKKLDTKSLTDTSTRLTDKVSSNVSRVDIGGFTYRQTKPGTLERVTTKKNRVIATRVLNKSVVQATSKHLKNQMLSKKQQYCMFYNRFGKCNRGDKCPYIHDPDRIAICTRFLRGTCKIKACPFSHKVSAEKMPVCSYYLKGMCNKADCPYLHVNVNRDAEICQDFLNGFCSLGKKCKKKHTLICPLYQKTGTCPNGIKCRLQHRKPKKAKHGKGDQCNKPESSPDISKNGPQESLDSVQEETCDIHLPFKERRLPAYISLMVKREDNIVNTVSGTSNIEDEDTENLKIRPQFEKP